MKNCSARSPVHRTAGDRRHAKVCSDRIEDIFFEMIQMTHVEFQDRDSGDRAFVALRADRDGIALVVSLASDGDLQVVMDTAAAIQLRDGLDHAIHLAGGTHRAGPP